MRRAPQVLGSEHHQPDRRTPDADFEAPRATSASGADELRRASASSGIGGGRMDRADDLPDLVEVADMPTMTEESQVYEVDGMLDLATLADRRRRVPANCAAPWTPLTHPAFAGGGSEITGHNPTCSRRWRAATCSSTTLPLVRHQR